MEFLVLVAGVIIAVLIVIRILWFIASLLWAPIALVGAVLLLVWFFNTQAVPGIQ